MKTSAIKMILCMLVSALGTSLCATAQTAGDDYSAMRADNARRIQAAQAEARRNAAAVAAINEAKARRTERSRILAERDAAEARRINNANHGIAD